MTLIDTLTLQEYLLHNVPFMTITAGTICSIVKEITSSVGKSLERIESIVILITMVVLLRAGFKQLMVGIFFLQRESRLLVGKNRETNGITLIMMVLGK